MYKAQTPNMETQGAPEVKEAQDVQVEVPVDQVGCKHRRAVPLPPCLCSVSPSACLPLTPSPSPGSPGLWNVLGPLQLAIARPSDPMSHIFPSAHLSSHALLLLFEVQCSLRQQGGHRRSRLPGMVFLFLFIY